jgi:hypothetical protein
MQCWPFEKSLVINIWRPPHGGETEAAAVYKREKAEKIEVLVMFSPQNNFCISLGKRKHLEYEARGQGAWFKLQSACKNKAPSSNPSFTNT